MLFVEKLLETGRERGRKGDGRTEKTKNGDGSKRERRGRNGVERGRSEKESRKREKGITLSGYRMF